MNRKTQKNRGMTYVELIVVLSIFAALSSVVFFNYGDFQDRIDIKNLASDIALKVVEAQKSSLDGRWDSHAIVNWKPGYGVYFDIMSNNKQFIHFVDLNNSNTYDGGTELLDTVNITKNNYISRIDSYSASTPTPIANNLTTTFSRPSSSAFFQANGSALISGFDYVQITIASPRGATALIKIYPSGRVQVN